MNYDYETMKGGVQQQPPQASRHKHTSVWGQVRVLQDAPQGPGKTKT